MKRGYAGMVATKVSEEWLAKAFPDEWPAVASFIRERPQEWRDVCEFNTEQECEPFVRLKRAFDDMYQDLMALHVMWHDAESVFDEVDGYAFVICGAYRRIKAAEDIDLETVTYVAFMEVNND